MQRTGDAFRQAIAVAAPTAVCIAVAVVVGHPMGDWEIAREGGEILLAGNFDVYAQMPLAQMGPLALVFGGALPGWAYLAVACALLPTLLLLILANSPLKSASVWTVVSGGLLLAWPWAAFGVQGHLDEAFVVVGAVCMVIGYEQHRKVLLCAAFLVAIAAKPTAIVLLPLVFLRSAPAGFVALLGMAAIWAPFFLADPLGFLAAGRGQGDLWPGSVHALLGAEPQSGFPQWVRPFQLAGGLTLVWVLTWFRGPRAALVGVLAFRTLLEPGAWNYYGGAIAAAGLLFDARHLRLPVVTTLGFLSFATVLSTPVSTMGGHVRLVALAAALSLAVLSVSRRGALKGGAPASLISGAGTDTDVVSNHQQALPADSSH